MTEPTTKIRKSDLPRLEAYAEKHSIDCVEAITLLLDLASTLDKIDITIAGTVTPPWTPNDKNFNPNQLSEV